MLFAAILIAAFLGRFCRGCVKWLVLAGLLALVANRDPVLWSKLAELFDSAFHDFREWILRL
jgi:hypothetical protein